MLEIEYEFREQDLIFYNEVRFGQSETVQKSLKRNRIIFPGIAILLGIFMWVYQSNSAGFYLVAIGAVWSLISPKYIKWDLRRQILNKYTAKEKENMFGNYYLRIEPDVLVEKSPSGKHKTPWEEILRVEYQKKYVFIYVELDTALIIPVDAVTKGDLEQFAEQTEKMIERHAG
ncbi:MAG: YcxB family protein [Gammaproteobacteria bacterium]